MSKKYAIRDASRVTNDGTMVESLRRLPATGQVERIRNLIEPKCCLLDLGAGVGRLANPLAKLGYQVTAVDDSADLLAEIPHARRVCARIEKLRLPEKFDAVLLASSLINYPGVELRRGVLATVAHHLKPTGKAVIQWRSPLWFASLRQGGSSQWADGPLVRIANVHTDGDGLVNGDVTFEFDGQTWCQPFRLEYMTSAELRDELGRVGLQLDTSDPDTTEWLEVTVDDAGLSRHQVQTQTTTSCTA
ncbi:class I SAM-dependent methyltransferase [Mycobacterium riyadhense]|uniref:Ubiquinone biosynthesis O-methyltransferase n=2 Tax=Mycobacterium riyadhense TaxID=486698 RepID=A0A653EVU0_9MYCO|nr:class I SAM-dependent methyltransferase [Mycobacterium riyadhense]VTP01453.1 Ubiquinone biosynthesis O-methyltransferase [Mycobacterium riyadhense]